MGGKPFLVISLLGLVIAGGVLAAMVDAPGSRGVEIRVNGQALPEGGELRYSHVYADALALAGALGLETVFFPDYPLRGVWLRDEADQNRN